MHTLGFITPFIDWWNGLSTAQEIFYGLGLVAGLVTILLAILAALGADHDDAIDAVGGAHDGMHGEGIFSVKTLTGFFLGFGFAGGMALDAGLPLLAAIGLGLASGGALMALVVVMFRAIRSMRSDGTMRIGDAVGAVGTVYVTLPPNKGQGGQVVVNFSGRQETFAALSGSEKAIASGDKVKVLGVIDSRTVLVEAL